MRRRFTDWWLVVLAVNGIEDSFELVIVVGGISDLLPDAVLDAFRHFAAIKPYGSIRTLCGACAPCQLGSSILETGAAISNAALALYRRTWPDLVTQSPALDGLV